MTASNLLEAVTAWARAKADVRAVVLVGSRASVDDPADQFSDYDVVLFVDQPAPYIESAACVEAFGRPLLTFIESTAAGGQLERRVLFDSGVDVDFALVPAGAASRLLDDADTAEVIRRGYRVLYDELDLAGRFRALAPARRKPDFTELSHDFWYHVLWAAKKLRRGETYVAKQACDCYLKARIVELLHARYPNPWHDGRFVERWAPANALSALGETFATYDAAAVATALRGTATLFARLERELGVDAVDQDEMMRRLENVLTS